MSTKTIKAPIKKLIETRIKEYNKGETIFNITPNNSNVRVNLDGNSYAFSLNTTEYHHCCGFREIGSIDITKNVELTGSLERDLLTKFLRKITEQFIDAETGTKIGLSFTVPFESGVYDRFIEAALKVGFREVAEFVNKNSSNRLKHFIFA